MCSFQHSRQIFVRSEGAPVPIGRHTGTQTFSDLALPQNIAQHALSLCAIHCRRSRLIALQALAIRSTRACLSPALEVSVAVLTCALQVAAGVVIGFLVDGNEVGGVLLAECVAAASTVVFACEVCEVSGASCVVANDGFAVVLE